MNLLRTSIALILISGLTGCAKFNSDQKARISRLMEEGRKLSVATEAGVTRSDFKKALVSYKDAFEMALTAWPKNVHSEARENAINSLKLYGLADWVWDHEQEYKEVVNRTLGSRSSDLESIGIRGVVGEEAKQKVFDRLEMPEKYQTMFLESGPALDSLKEDPKLGKSHIPFKSIGLILNEASKSFKAARASVLSDL